MATSKPFWVACVFVCFEIMLICSAYPTESKSKNREDRENSSKDKALTCYEEIQSMYVDEKFIGKVPEYDLLEILRSYGGAPGMVDLKKGDETIGKRRIFSDDPSKMKLVYNYSRSDNTTYIRLEKGFRAPGEPANQSLEITGEFFWYPDDFCGWMRRADYKFNQNGFSANVHYGTKCELGILFPQDSNTTMLSCIPVAHCTSQRDTCVAGAFVTPLEYVLRND